MANKILIVGAGAVGRIYGAHLAAGGADVSVFVRPRREAEARQGYSLHQLRWLRSPRSYRWQDFGVETDAVVAATKPWDVVWLCVASHQLRGDWIEPLLHASGAPTIVCQLNVPSDHVWLAERVPADRAVQGTIQMASYSVALAGDGLGTGTRYFITGPQTLSGDRRRVADIVTTLRRGGLRARYARRAGESYGTVGAGLLPLMGALEVAGWSFSSLRRSPVLALGTRAARQALVIRGAELGRGTAPAAILLRPACARAVLTLLPLVAPFPAEAFFPYHFEKVKAQTRILLREYVQLGTARGLPVDQLKALHDALAAVVDVQPAAPDAAGKSDA